MNTSDNYRIGAGGLPVDVRIYGNVSNMPNSVSQIESGQNFAGETHRVEMAYDEGGQRILYRITNKATGESYAEASIPGVATYAKANGGAWQLLLRYYPYGTVHEIKGDSAADRARWQGKEPRFFDPYFGLWISPDPAGQFANPYTYGGDPLNYVDPDGEFIHIIVGVVVGAVAGALGGGVLGGAAGGAAGGAVGSAGSYGTSVWTQGENFSWSGLGGATGSGALGGAISGGVSEGLYALGATGSSWSDPKIYGSIGTINSAASGSISSGAVAWMQGENVKDAMISGALWGAGTAMVSSAASFFAIPEAGTKEGTGEWMVQKNAHEYMVENPGAVGAAVADSPVGYAISILSGNGPFSHVQGSDVNGDVLENNSKGVQTFNRDDAKADRMMYVTNRYSVKNVISIHKAFYEDKNVKLNKYGNMHYSAAGLCTGAVHQIIPNYPGGSPNTLYHWNVSSNPYRTMLPAWIW